MQISDLVGQYNHAVSAGTEKVTGTKGVENLVSSLKSLTKGNIFEGTVSSMKNGRITLSLSNGTQISARMDGKVALTEGQSMFFQVKSNDGSTIAIRPFVVDGTGVNYTLMQALSAAGLPTEPKYLSMVDKMMEEQMPIDRGSLQQMARLANANGKIDVRTLVQMNKLGIEITPQNAAQFENYLGDKQAISAAIDHLIDELPLAMQGSSLPDETLRQMNAQVLSVITEGLADAQEAEIAEALQESGETENRPLPNLLMQAAESAAVELAATESADAEAALTGTDEMQAEHAQVPAETESFEADTDESPAEQQTIRGQAGTEEGSVPKTAAFLESAEAAPAEHTLASVLDSKQLTNLNGMLKELVGKELHYEGDKSVSGLLQDLRELLDSELPVDRDRLQQLLSSKEFKELVKDTLEQQWTIKPEELTGSDKINKLYEKLDGHMNRIGDVLKATGQENANFTQTAADIRSNVDFMNQINQTYTYVQIPLKMSGQTASGELYVYTNKKALAEGDKELTAFLHLDMDHLGPTDISVKLLNREVSTNFYLENDSAYDLIEAHLPILEERLREKGYHCKVAVINEARHVNFVEDFLKKDAPSAGQLHRYSFDMRA